MNSDRTRNKGKGNAIGQLEEHTLGYYRRVSEMLKQDFDSAEERALFLDNVFKQLSQEVLRVSQNQTGSSIVEDLIRKADRLQLISTMLPFAQDWETACCDRFASYVTQSMVIQCSQYFDCEAALDDDSNTENTILELFDSLYEFLCSSLAAHMQHMYASHVVRVVFEVLAGRPISDSIVRSRMSRQQQQTKHQSKLTVNLKTPPSACKEKLNELCYRTVTLKKLEDHLSHTLSSPVLQAMLLSLESLDADKSTSLIKKFTKNSKLFETSTNNGVPDVIVSEIGSHLMEQYLAVISAKQFDRIHRKHFCGHLVEMANHPLANFVLQKFISGTHTPEQCLLISNAVKQASSEQFRFYIALMSHVPFHEPCPIPIAVHHFQQVFDELIKSFEQILALNHIGIIIRLAETCIKHNTRQKKFIKALQKAFHCYKPIDRRLKLVHLLASLSTFEIFYNLPEESTPVDDIKVSVDDTKVPVDDIKVPVDDTKVPVADTKKCTKSVVKSFNYHGSVLTQSLLKFGNPHPVIDSLMTLGKSEMCSVCCDVFGSRVIEAFVSSDTVGDASRTQLYTNLKQLYFTIACDKFGSRTFDSLWNAAGIDQRLQIATELSQRSDALRANKFGSFIYERCALRTFISRQNEWKQIQNGETRKRKLMKDIIDDFDSNQTTVTTAKKTKV